MNPIPPTTCDLRPSDLSHLRTAPRFQLPLRFSPPWNGWPFEQDSALAAALSRQKNEECVHAGESWIYLGISSGIPKQRIDRAQSNALSFLLISKLRRWHWHRFRRLAKGNHFSFFLARRTHPIPTPTAAIKPSVPGSGAGVKLKSS